VAGKALPVPVVSRVAVIREEPSEPLDKTSVSSNPQTGIGGVRVEAVGGDSEGTVGVSGDGDGRVDGRSDVGLSTVGASDDALDVSLRDSASWDTESRLCT
jgi:hypothetical protein